MQKKACAAWKLEIYRNRKCSKEKKKEKKRKEKSECLKY